MDNTKEMEQAVATILRGLGYDTEHGHFIDTPRRVVSFLKEFAPIGDAEPALSFTTFTSGLDVSEMVTQRGIPFRSLCPHHLLPYFGHAAVGYIPADGKIAGLSKLARTVKVYSSQLIVQEELTQRIAQYIETKTGARGVGVQITAQHSCMNLRGPCVHGTFTTTTCLLGCFKADASVRAEFLGAIRG